MKIPVGRDGDVTVHEEREVRESKCTLTEFIEFMHGETTTPSDDDQVQSAAKELEAQIQSEDPTGGHDSDAGSCSDDDSDDDSGLGQQDLNPSGKLRPEFMAMKLLTRSGRRPKDCTLSLTWVTRHWPADGELPAGNILLKNARVRNASRCATCAESMRGLGMKRSRGETRSLTARATVHFRARVRWSNGKAHTARSLQRLVHQARRTASTTSTLKQRARPWCAQACDGTTRR